MKYKYKKSILGGTFDRFHKGHKRLIDTAFENSERVTIGIATTALFKHKNFTQAIEDYQTRKHNVETYLKSQNFLDRAEIIPISDIYGNSLTDSGIDAIFATAENLKNIEEINLERVKVGFNPLSIVIVEYVCGND